MTISTYRELMNYIDSITVLNNDIVTNLTNAYIHISGDIQVRIDIQMNLFIKNKLVEETVNFQKRLYQSTNLDGIQLEMMGLKEKYQILYNISKLHIIGDDTRNTITNYVLNSAIEYENDLKERLKNINNINMIFNNVKLGSLV